MKKLSKISESIWSDIQDRSSGEITRKEDNVNNMDMESFWLYIIKNYKERVRTLDKDHFCKDYDMDIVVDPSEDIVIFGSYVKDELVRIMVVLKTKAKDTTVKKIIDTSPDNFRWIRINSDKLELALNDGEVTNQTFVDLIEFFLNNQQVFESIWSDIQDRSNGDVIRDEDKFNPDYVDFGPDTTVYWAINNLEVDGEVKFYFDDVKDYNNNGWRLPTVDEVNQLKWNVRISWKEGCKHLEFDDGNELRLKTNGSGGFHMWTKEINTKFPSSAYAYGFDNSYIFDVNNFNKSINRLFVFLVKDKKVTESIWSDIQDRSSGETVRKEDEVNSMDGKQFYDYLQKQYNTLSKEQFHIDENFYQYTIGVPLLKKDETPFYLFIDSYKDNDYCFLHMSSSFQTKCHKLYHEKLKDNDIFDIDLVDSGSSTFGWFVEISTKDGNKPKNNFVIEVIDFILSQIENPFIKLIEKI